MASTSAVFYFILSISLFITGILEEKLVSDLALEFSRLCTLFESTILYATACVSTPEVNSKEPTYQHQGFERLTTLL